jgi:hypothetical protein
MGEFLQRALYRLARCAWQIIDAQEAPPVEFGPMVDVPEIMQVWELVGGERLEGVHLEASCKGLYCTIHRQSDHHMREWPQHWRSDRRLMERICPEHGVGHPDPDEINPDTLHGCCGCCSAPEPVPARPEHTPMRWDVV